MKSLHTAGQLLDELVAHKCPALYNWWPPLPQGAKPMPVPEPRIVILLQEGDEVKFDASRLIRDPSAMAEKYAALVALLNAE